MVINETGIITNWNKQAEKIFGWTRSEILRKQLANLIIPERYREVHKKGLKNYLKKEPGAFLNNRIETTALRKNGEEFPIELTVTALRLGESTTFSAFIRDITETKKA
ncbi:MAG: PAS domain S-box protein, partial [bacterium]